MLRCGTVERKSCCIIDVTNGVVIWITPVHACERKFGVKPLRKRRSFDLESRGIEAVTRMVMSGFLSRPLEVGVRVFEYCVLVK